MQLHDIDMINLTVSSLLFGNLVRAIRLALPCVQTHRKFLRRFQMTTIEGHMKPFWNAQIGNDDDDVIGRDL